MGAPLFADAADDTWCPAGAKIGLIDYGQSKQLPLDSKLAFAQLIHALDEQNDDQIACALSSVGVVLGEGSPALASKMAYGMFDTRGRCTPDSLSLKLYTAKQHICVHRAICIRSLFNITL